MKNLFSILFAFFFCVFIYPQNMKTPLEVSNFTKLTSYDELVQYLNELPSWNNELQLKQIAKSAEGRNLYVVKISNSKFGKDKSKIKVLLFCQQHGDEPSGKEGALLLLKDFASGKLDSLLTRMDVMIVPQVNPDGSEKNQRRNGNDADLNRDHLTLVQPETQGLQKLFYKYLPEACMDIHEYGPFSESWIKYGYIKNIDEQVGTLTNPNISKAIRDYSEKKYIPYIKKYFNKRNFSFQEYILGGPPEVELIRYSTFDINDGRQNPGILGSFSFIQEGLNNSKDNQVENIKRRSFGQKTGMLGFLKFIYLHKDKIKSMVRRERKKLIKNNVSNKVAIQMDHVKNGEKLKLHLLSLYSNKDTVITVNDFRPVVKSLYDVERPSGYLVPKNLKEIIDWADRQSVKYFNYKKREGDKIEQYYISRIDSMNFEGDTIVNPAVEVKEIPNSLSEGDYIFIPTKQLDNNMIVTALEPKSELGLVTYKSFEHLLKIGENYPILRVVKNNR